MKRLEPEKALTLNIAPTISVFEPDTKAIPLSRAAENLLHRNNILSLLSGDEKLSGTPIDAVPGGTGV